MGVDIIESSVEPSGRTHPISPTVAAVGVILGGLCGIAALVLPGFEAMYRDMDPRFPEGWSWQIRLMVAVPAWGWLSLGGAFVAFAMIMACRLRRCRLSAGQSFLLDAAVTLFFAFLIGFTAISLFLPLSGVIIQSVEGAG